MCVCWRRRQPPGPRRSGAILPAASPNVPPPPPKSPSPPLSEYYFSAARTVTQLSPDPDDNDQFLYMQLALHGQRPQNQPPPRPHQPTCRSDMTNPPLLPSIRPIIRKDTLAFNFRMNDGTFHKMPKELSEFEKIVGARGFTLHDEYFVSHSMAVLLKKYEFETPLAMYSNYGGKSVGWFIANNQEPFWLFAFLDTHGIVIEYAHCLKNDANKMWNWGSHIELAAWMAGVIAPRGGITMFT